MQKISKILEVFVIIYYAGVRHTIRLKFNMLN